MKTKQLFLVAFVLMNFFSYAAVITVSNNPNSPGQYSDLQTAIDAAVAGDIIYVHGSLVSYGGVTITKQLSLIGDGALPNKSLQMPTTIDNITFGFTANGLSNGGNSSVTGCRINTISTNGFTNAINQQFGLNGITLRRNRIEFINIGGNNSASYNNYTIQNNVISSVNIGAGASRAGNILITHNIIGGSINGLQPLTGGSNVISNNVINGGVSSNKQCIFANNIFYNSTFSGNTNNSFTKNIFYTPLVTINQASFEGSANTFSGNIYNQDPLFTSFEIASSVVSSYDYSNPTTGPFANYRLLASSPGKNLGTDGTDIGLYGGTTPFAEGATTDSRFRYFPAPAFPQMLEMNILNITLPTNGTLNINFTARKND
jgi:hypothetical protein